jgi:hypothetical protein
MYIVTKCLLTNYLLITKDDFTVEKTDRYHLSEEIKVNKSNRVSPIRYNEIHLTK